MSRSLPLQAAPVPGPITVASGLTPCLCLAAQPKAEVAASEDKARRLTDYYDVHEEIGR